VDDVQMLIAAVVELDCFDVLLNARPRVF